MKNFWDGKLPVDRKNWLQNNIPTVRGQILLGAGIVSTLLPIYEIYFIHDKLPRYAIKSITEYADGKINEESLINIMENLMNSRRIGYDPIFNSTIDLIRFASHMIHYDGYCNTVKMVIESTFTTIHSQGIYRSEYIQQQQNEIINKFVPIKIWSDRFFTTNTVSLAQTIYRDEAFGLTPILADALMDAGYEDELELNYLRTGTVFGRGMAIFDKLLSK